MLKTTVSPWNSIRTEAFGEVFPALESFHSLLKSDYMNSWHEREWGAWEGVSVSDRDTVGGGSLRKGFQNGIHLFCHSCQGKLKLVLEK